MNRNQLAKDIAVRLKKIRLSIGGKQYHMANRMKIDPSSYSRNESGQNAPELYSFYLLAKNHGYSLDWLVCNRGPEMFKEQYRGQENNEVEINEMLKHMEKIPLLRYHMLAAFLKFKEDNRDLIEREMG